MDFLSFITLSSHYGGTSNVEFSEVGQKAVGILNCPDYLTPPFFVLNSSLYKKWLNNNAEAEQLLDTILLELDKRLFLSQNVFIVRSSAKYESLEERGQYVSSKGNIGWKDLFDTVKDIWKQNLPNFSENKPNNEFAIIIQEYIKPNLSGHLSNERRISRSRTDWIIEIVNNKNEFLENKKISTKPITNNYTEESFRVKTKQDVIESLKLIAFKNVLEGLRVHLEWIWDGSKVWIVQNDVEILSEKGTAPGSQWKKSKKIIEENTLKSFNLFEDSKHKWKKVECVRTFVDCDLPYGKVFILENPLLLDEIYNGTISVGLSEDLEWLLTSPIVIRMDVKNADGYNNILLPRTETIFTIEDAILFITTQTTSFIKQGLAINDFCFLIHRFINTKSCALAFSKPNLHKARIDSTWGIVDGLYYHPHDSFEVNLSSEKSNIKKLIRCKTEYLDVDSTGTWFSKKAGLEWDWAESLTNRQVLKIAEYNTRLSDFLDKPVTVMYFVDVDRLTGYPEILPWFYTTDEITETNDKFTDAIFSGQKELIQNENDFNILVKNFDSNGFNKITLKLKLNPDILRDKELIEKIGDFAKEKNIPIELEGSILSHTYYILRKKNAKVKCINPFEPTYPKQNFFKLVRDRIPVTIESKGEKVKSVKVDSFHFLKLIKQKAIEEAYEFFWEKENDLIIEELADIYEVIRAACKVFGIKINQIEDIANNKSEKKGGFDLGIVLVNTEETSLIDVINNSGESLLIDEKKEKTNIKPKKLPIRKIAFGTDASITLPYISPNSSKNSIQIKAPSELQYAERIQINYTNQGIRLSFIKPKEFQTKSQLPLFPDL